ncbi:MAG: hypothetical protein JWR63_2831 [Conexibacter sp.]|nr:hypothetical protein [Conexibacter sp.]
MRSNALAALSDKRPLLDGAALFWILPTRRHGELVQLLVAFQILANFHDHAGERAGRAPTAMEPAGTIRTLAAVIDVERPWAGYFGEWPPADGGYLDALASTCRSVSARLPGYPAARTLLVQQIRRAQVMDIEHGPAARDRPRLLRHFAASDLGPTEDLEWWELAAGAASLLTVIVTLALAADERTTPDDLDQAVDAYIWVGSVGSLLDNYIDQADDARTGAHNYLSYYGSRHDAAERLASLIDRALCKARSLRQGERHLVIVASMTAMYLSSGSARSEPLRASTKDLITRSGSLTRLLLPLIRAWRIAYGEADA